MSMLTPSEFPNSDQNGTAEDILVRPELSGASARVSSGTPLAELFVPFARSDGEPVAVVEDDRPARLVSQERLLSYSAKRWRQGLTGPDLPRP